MTVNVQKGITEMSVKLVHVLHRRVKMVVLAPQMEVDFCVNVREPLMVATVRIQRAHPNHVRITESAQL